MDRRDKIERNKRKEKDKKSLAGDQNEGAELRELPVSIIS